MGPGGVTEILWYFAGYLQIAEDDVRARLVYEDGAFRVRPDDYVARLPEFDSAADLAQMFTRRLRVPEILPPDPLTPENIENIRSQLTQPSHRSPRPDDSDADPPPRSGGGSGGAGGSAERVITVTYEEGGEQKLIEIDQLNMLSDDDQFQVIANSGVTELNNVYVAATLQELVSGANNQVPDFLAMPQSGTTAAADFLAAHDADMVENGGGNEPPLAPGLYVNGVLQEGSDPSTIIAPDPTLPTVPSGGLGQWAELGANLTINAAQIIDLNEAAPTMIVMGDFFRTNAIVQTNSFIDNDHVDLASQLPADVMTGGNQADNIAELIQQGGLHGDLSGQFFSGWNWRVEVVEGDFYDINVVSQRNYMHDNDVTVQDYQQSHFHVQAGANEQFNVMELHELTQQYDLIIIGGSYHGANLIFQQNIVLDSDVIMVAAGDGTAPGQSVFSGQNDLENDATIANYGSDSFSPLSSGMADMVAAVASQQGILDGSFASLIPGNGSGELRILYVSGDYYDINAMWQTNVIADVDTAVQFLPDQASEDDFTQSAKTGGNKASNIAFIVDAGSTLSFLGGELYEDSILIQADLVTDDDDSVAYRDTQTLVTEVIAFVGPASEERDDEVVPIPMGAPADDVMGSILH
jgi:hypothetical protein